jgi:hypothetical protein
MKILSLYHVLCSICSVYSIASSMSTTVTVKNMNHYILLKILFFINIQWIGRWVDLGANLDTMVKRNISASTRN